MNALPDHNWQPDPQLLAAYFDGELDVRLGELRARVEAWLENHPNARAEAEEVRRLRKIWADTTPGQPSSKAWNNTLDRIEEARRQRRASPTPRYAARSAIALGVGILVLIGALFASVRLSLSTPVPHPAPLAQAQKNGLVDDMEVLPVATAGEVAILRVEGQDTGSLVVGELPLLGPLELADPGEIRFFQIRPDQRDRMVPQVRHAPNRPMIWARVETDNE